MHFSRQRRATVLAIRTYQDPVFVFVGARFVPAPSMKLQRPQMGELIFAVSKAAHVADQSEVVFEVHSQMHLDARLLKSTSNRLLHGN